jgi:hypothetical protein
MDIAAAEEVKHLGLIANYDEWHAAARQLGLARFAGRAVIDAYLMLL